MQQFHKIVRTISKTFNFTRLDNATEAVAERVRIRMNCLFFKENQKNIRETILKC